MEEKKKKFDWLGLVVKLIAVAIGVVTGTQIDI